MLGIRFRRERLPLAEQAEFNSKLPQAFLSYVRKDDDYLGGGISWLRGALERAFEATTGKSIHIFQDVEDLRPGDAWLLKLDQAIEASQLYIPILSPRFFESDFCRREALSFLAYERREGRKDLILPIYMIDTDLLENAELRAKDPLAAELYERQHDDWRALRFQLHDPGPRERIELLARAIHLAVARPTANQVDEAPAGSDCAKGSKPEPKIDMAAIVRLGRGRREHLSPQQDEECHNSEHQPFGLQEAVPFDHTIKELNNRIEILNNQIDDLKLIKKLLEKSRKLLVGLCFVLFFLGLGSPWIAEVLMFAAAPEDSRHDKMVEAPLLETPKPSDAEPTIVGNSDGDPSLGLSPKQEGFGTDTQDQSERIFAHYPNDSFRDCDDCPEMVVVPAGSFFMGSPISEEGRSENEGPRRKVTISYPFALGKYEVTRGEFGIFARETGYDAAGCRYWSGNEWLNDRSRSWRNPGFEQTDRHPVACVSWKDAVAYAGWLSGRADYAYRLPSEAEWEYAVRAGTETPFYWGEENDSPCRYANGLDAVGRDVNRFNRFAFSCSDSFAQTAPVGSFEANAFGLHDMTGNLWEWVDDTWHRDYIGAPADGGAWITGGRSWRVNRGGSWAFNPWNLRSANRRALSPDERNFGLGFRVAKTLRQDQGD